MKFIKIVNNDTLDSDLSYAIHLSYINVDKIEAILKYENKVLVKFHSGSSDLNLKGSIAIDFLNTFKEIMESE